MRLAALYSHPVQYFAPLFRELGRRSDIDFTVYFMSRRGVDVTYDSQFGQSFKWDIPLLEGYKYHFLPNLRNTTSVDGFFKLANVSVIPTLLKGRYDALLVHGYEHLAKWLAFAAAKSCGTKILLRGDSNLTHSRTLIRRASKKVALGSLFRMVDAFTYVGTLNRQYYEFYGAKPGQLFFCPYCIDGTPFVGATNVRRTELRQSLGILDDSPVVLYVGKVYDVKQPELLLRAFAQVRSRRKCHLLFVGDGPYRARVESRIRTDSIPDVHLTGFVNQTEIPAMYLCGDIFVLPSLREAWGLVVNEAMSMGLPVVVTDRVGCAADLVLEGGNGYVVRYDDETQLADRIESLVVSPELRHRFGCRSREIVRNWTVAKAADGIVEAAQRVLHPQVRANENRES